jgi:hypothetical protein
MTARAAVPRRKTPAIYFHNRLRTATGSIAVDRAAGAQHDKGGLQWPVRMEFR